MASGWPVVLGCGAHELTVPARASHRATPRSCTRDEEPMIVFLKEPALDELLTMAIVRITLMLSRLVLVSVGTASKISPHRRRSRAGRVRPFARAPRSGDRGCQPLLARTGHGVLSQDGFDVLRELNLSDQRQGRHEMCTCNGHLQQWGVAHHHDADTSRGAASYARTSACAHRKCNSEADASRGFPTAGRREQCLPDGWSRSRRSSR